MVERPFLPIYRLSRLAKMKMGREGMSTRHIGIPDQHCIGRPTVFDQIYAFYLRSASAGICGPALDDIYDFQQRATKNERYRERNCVPSVSS